MRPKPKMHICPPCRCCAHTQPTTQTCRFCARVWFFSTALRSDSLDNNIGIGDPTNQGALPPQMSVSSSILVPISPEVSSQ